MYKLTLEVTAENKDKLKVFTKISKIYEQLSEFEIVKFEVKEIE